MERAPELICYVHEGWAPRIRAAAPRRDWMDGTPELFAHGPGDHESKLRVQGFRDTRPPQLPVNLAPPPHGRINLTLRNLGLAAKPNV